VTSIALIVGSGFARLGFEVLTRSPTKTPYGEPSSAVLTLGIAGTRVPCIARHGEEHHLAPHEINYRANVWALAQRGVRACVGINTVGAIEPKLLPGELAVPNQLIDDTYGRLSSYGGAGAPVRHVEFGEPFSESLSGRVAAAAHACGFAVRSGTNSTPSSKKPRVSAGSTRPTSTTTRIGSSHESTRARPSSA
jgi:purine nucleoside phosphorylase